ncbi:MAG: thioredoxin family protein [Actinobacteria bacterium]|nr:thioredoxin family protein [Actinomycetota bacterium]
MGDVRQVPTSANFEPVVESGTPVLVDVRAESCGPCKAMDPVLGEVALARAEKLAVGKVDILAEPDVALRYKVSAIPLPVLFRGVRFLPR